MFWQAVIFGPEDTPWEGGAVHPAGRRHASSRLTRAPGTFKLTLTFTEDYPNKAPTVRFESKMFHPNSAPSCVKNGGSAELRL